MHLFDDASFTYVGRVYWTDGPFRAIRRLAPTCLLLQPMPHYHVHQPSRLGAITFCGAFSSVQPTVSIFGTVHQLTGLASTGVARSLSVSPSVTLANLALNVLDARFQGQPNPLLDVRMRQALALATDRVTLARNVLGATGAQARALAAPSIYFAPARAPGVFRGPSVRGAWDPLARTFIPYGTQSLADARRLLTAAGYGAGLTLDLAAFGSHPWRLATLTELARQWKAIGVQTTIRRLLECFPCDPGLTSGNFEGFLSEIPDGPDPTALDQYLTGPRVSNVSGIADARLQAALSQGRRGIDLASRAPAYRTAQTIMARQAYWIPLYYLPDVVLHDPRLVGPAASAVPGQETWNVSTWHFRYECRAALRLLLAA
jgi:ABC-type transport system substrate-binding protein